MFTPVSNPDTDREKKSIGHNSARKNVFLRACCCWNDRFSLSEIDQIQIFKLSGNIVHGDSYLELIFLNPMQLHYK